VSPICKGSYDWVLEIGPLPENPIHHEEGHNDSTIDVKRENYAFFKFHRTYLSNQ